MAVLLRALPRESALSRALGGEAAEWGVTDYLLANVLDATQNLTWVVSALASKKPPDRPKPFPRPKPPKQVAAPEPVKMSAASEVRSFFMAVNRKE